MQLGKDLFPRLFLQLLAGSGSLKLVELRVSFTEGTCGSWTAGPLIREAHNMAPCYIRASMQGEQDTETEREREYKPAIYIAVL